MDYKELLKDILWIRKRKAIIYRDGGRCTVCESKKNLEVHHTFYYEDYPLPWLYPNASLITVCYKCHREYHNTHELEIRKRPIKVIKYKKSVKSRKNKLIKKTGYLGNKKRSLAMQQSKKPRYRFNYKNEKNNKIPFER